ncbi:MAG: bifunctional phosphopantothenoylcysteine decarboxylase/phosphopantothenate--cysteine ligase CoaBC [Syntrophales bacterium]|jgi:phosphopantothenoylcysteine decarboxylase/phosphopantothenate--cysteine ligase
MIKGRKIVLGVTGGIAAYKAAELTRLLIREGADVKVIMTRNATEFVAPLTFQTLSGKTVFLDLFSLNQERGIAHISLAEFADILIVAPATANMIGKIAAGIADDLLTSVILATRAPIIICPAMNTKMYNNTIVKANIKKLSALGYHFVAPGSGQLACGTEGQGRLAELDNIMEAVAYISTSKDLEGEHILVTAGPTREPLDPVRFITNYSSGKMGYALARAARLRGADVTLVSGPASLTEPTGIRFVPVTSARDMEKAVMKHLGNATVVIKAAAVADYRPAVMQAGKIKKKEGALALQLERNPDIIATVGRKKGERVLVGFAMETEDLIENARKKLIDKNMDLIVANDLSEPGAGFQCDTNIIRILDRKGNVETLSLMDKSDAADHILDRIKDLLIAMRKAPRKKR